MPAKKKTTKKPKPIKVKHLTNTLYWSIKMQTQVRTVLLSLDPNMILAADSTLLSNGMGGGSNPPRGIYCPPPEKA
jgi:hypothetical protein